MDDEDLLDMSGEDLIRETQESPATFSRNIIKSLRICQTTGMGTETVNNNNNHKARDTLSLIYIMNSWLCYHPSSMLV